MKVIFRTLLAVGAVLAFTSSAASQEYTPCFSQQVASVPYPVIGGFTRLQITGAGASQIIQESFIDGGTGGWLEGYSLAVNARPGATDCDQSPDVRAAWGYSASDDTNKEFGTLQLSVTAWRQALANPPSGGACVTNTNPIVYVYSVSTGPVADWFWSEAGSALFTWDLSDCDDTHDFHQIRMRGVASTSLGAASVDEGCFVVPVSLTPLVCPGQGANCL